MNYHSLNDKLNCNFHTFCPVIPFGFIQSLSPGLTASEQSLLKHVMKTRGVRIRGRHLVVRPRDRHASGGWERVGTWGPYVSLPPKLEMQVTAFSFSLALNVVCHQRGAAKAAWLSLKTY